MVCRFSATSPDAFATIFLVRAEAALPPFRSMPSISTGRFFDRLSRDFFGSRISRTKLSQLEPETSAVRHRDFLFQRRLSISPQVLRNFGGRNRLPEKVRKARSGDRPTSAILTYSNIPAPVFSREDVDRADLPVCNRKNRRGRSQRNSGQFSPRRIRRYKRGRRSRE